MIDVVTQGAIWEAAKELVMETTCVVLFFYSTRCEYPLMTETNIMWTHKCIFKATAHKGPKHMVCFVLSFLARIFFFKYCDTGIVLGLILIQASVMTNWCSSPAVNTDPDPVYREVSA
jgi:hypothetical protein